MKKTEPFISIYTYDPRPIKAEDIYYDITLGAGISERDHH